jgi:hypothetical protein
MAARFNLFGFSGASGLVGFSPGITDIVPSQPLSAIVNPRVISKGGLARTHALVAGSPAIDAINDGTCPPPARDQRGVIRAQDANGDGGTACDIGSLSLYSQVPHQSKHHSSQCHHLRRLLQHSLYRQS